MILDQVRQGIDEADIVVAIITGLNPNVFLEIGLALSRRPPLLVATSCAEMPFDVRHLRCLGYGQPGELETLAARLEKAIRETLAQPIQARRRETEKRLAEVAEYPLPRVETVDPYLLLGVTRSPHVDDHAARGERPPYVARTVDRSIDAALREHGLVLITGFAASGKTRSAFEAVRRLGPDTRLLLAKRPADLAEILRLYPAIDTGPGAVVLWLDDLERYAAVLDASSLVRLHGELGLIVVATVRSSRYADLKASARALVDRMREVQVRGEMDAAEAAAAARLYPRENFRGGLGESLLAAALLRERFDHGGEELPAGEAVVWATVDWQRMGLRGITEQRLRDLFDIYLPKVAAMRRADDGQFRAGLEWATTAITRNVALLMREPRGDREAYATLDYLVDHLETRPDRGAQRDAFAYVLERDPADVDFLAVSQAAGRYDHVDLAELAARRAVQRHNRFAHFALGSVIARHENRLVEAEHAFQAALQAGDTRGHLGLGALLMRQGRLAESEAAFRAAINAGFDIAYINLGYLLQQQPGRAADAEWAYRGAIEHGFPELQLLLGALLAGQPGREAEAEHCYREALKGTLNRGMALHNLGRLLHRQPGRQAEAEAAFRAAIDARETEALLSLGKLLGSQGRHADAESVLREAIRAGTAEAHWTLADVLAEQPGREAEAETEYRLAIEQGFPLANRGLGVLLMVQPARARDAEQALLGAIRHGHTGSHYNLGVLLTNQPGRSDEAEASFRAAIAEGLILGELGLGLLLASQPGREREARAALLRAAEAGIPQAREALRRLHAG
jgi:tetratricopeptide (TPR) repeat protein